jgi:hypothetical protein
MNTLIIKKKHIGIIHLCLAKSRKYLNKRINLGIVHTQIRVTRKMAERI